MLVPGSAPATRLSTCSTPHRYTDPDIDPGQTAVGIDGPQYRNSVTKQLTQDNVDFPLANIIVCYSDHDDAGQNEPYAHSNGGPGANDGVSDANEVYAKNRPDHQAVVASLGQGVVRAIEGYKLGLGYIVEHAGTRWPTPLPVARRRCCA